MATVHLLVPADESAYVEPDLDPRVQVWPFQRTRRTQPLAQLRMSRELVRRVRQLAPDVLHVQQGHYVFNFALGRLARTPLVLTVHEVMDRRGPRRTRHRVPQWPYTRGLRRARRVLVYGEPIRSQVVREGVDPGRVHVVPRAAPPLATATREPNEPTVLFFGRIWPYKGLQYLIEAEPAITRRVPDARIVIAGCGEDFARYRRLMSDPGRFEVRDYFVPRRERDELFRRASVVVLPYVNATTSAVIPIAYAHRKPVVVTDVGGLPDAVEDGRTGLVVPPRDPVALAGALVRLLRDDALRREYGEAARRKLAVEGAPELVGRRALDVYRLAAAAPSP